MNKTFFLLKSFISIVACTISFLLAMFVGVLSSYARLEQTYNNIDKGNIYISIQHESNPINLPDEYHTLENFAELNSRFYDVENCEYFALYRQPLYSKDNNENLYFDYTTNELTGTPQGILCVQLSGNVQDIFSLAVNSGRKLTADDFVYNLQKTVPVLMGADYLETYSLGDIFQAEYLYCTYTFQVVGFLSENSIIEQSTGSIFLDKYIIMPMFQINNESLVEQMFVPMKIHYANMTSGVFCADRNNYQKVLTSIENILAESKVGTYSFRSSSINQQMKWYTGLSLYAWLCLSIILLITFELLSIVLLSRVNKALRTPATKKYGVLIEVVLSLFIAGCIAFLLNVYQQLLWGVILALITVCAVVILGIMCKPHNRGKTF